MAPIVVAKSALKDAGALQHIAKEATNFRSTGVYEEPRANHQCHVQVYLYEVDDTIGVLRTWDHNIGTY